jgi:hypothetical protein
MPGNAPSYLRPGAQDRILGRMLVLLVRIGLIRALRRRRYAVR